MTILNAIIDPDDDRFILALAKDINND